MHTYFHLKHSSDFVIQNWYTLIFTCRLSADFHYTELIHTYFHLQTQCRFSLYRIYTYLFSLADSVEIFIIQNWYIFTLADWVQLFIMKRNYFRMWLLINSVLFVRLLLYFNVNTPVYDFVIIFYQKYFMIFFILSVTVWTLDYQHGILIGLDCYHYVTCEWEVEVASG